MAFGTALYTSVSGLNAMSADLSVIGNNISNSNTVGFKADTTEFANLLSTSLGGSTGLDAGSGVQVDSVAADFSQGTLQATANPLDMAIQGSGFFSIKDPNGSQFYTRAGQFSVDKDGNIVTPTGDFVQGAVAVDQPVISKTGTTPGTFGAIGNINMSQIGIGSPAATANATIFANLSQSAPLDDPTSATLTNTNVNYNTVGAAATGTKPFVITTSNNSIKLGVLVAGVMTYKTFTLNTGSYDGEGLANQIQNLLNNANGGANADYSAAAYQINGAAVSAAATVVYNDPKIGLNLPANSGAGTPYTFTITAGTAFNIDWTQKDGLQNILGYSSTNTNGTGAGITALAAAGAATSDFETAGFDPTNPGTAFSTSMTLYDSAGNGHLANIYFEQIDNSELLQNANLAAKGNTWMWWSSVSSGDSASGLTQIASQGTLEFNDAGALVDTVAPTYNSFDFSGGVKQAQPITFDFGQLEAETVNQGGSGTAGTTQFGGSSSSVANQYQDGYAAGSLDSYAVSQTGVITGTFTNGQTKNIAQIELVRFNAPDKLTDVGNNMYSQTSDSGQPIPGLAGNAGFGKIFSSSLEESNVDLSSEFVAMITVQSAYQASAKVISTSEELFTALQQAKQ